MKHYAEDELTLYHYGETDGAEIERHLAECADCRAEYARLGQLFGALDELPVPRRSESYPRQVWQQIEARLPRSRRVDWRAWFSVPRLALAGSMAVLLFVAFLLGQQTRPVGDPGQPIPEQVRERILLIAVGDHLERSQRILLELIHAEGNGEVDISTQQELARDLVSNNRMYRQTAARSGDETVAELLDELERLLVEVANGPAELASFEMDELRRRIERKGLLFKIRVIGDDARQQAAPSVAGPQV
jgi:hypothetical protein